MSINRPQRNTEVEEIIQEKSSENEDGGLPPVTHQSHGVHRSILTAYWAVILISLPIWWSMTSIERLSLPTSRIAEQQQRIQDIRFPIDILVHSRSSEVNIDDIVAKVDSKVKQCPTLGSDDGNHLDIRVMSSREAARTSELYEVEIQVSATDAVHLVHDRHLDFYTKTPTAVAEDLGGVLCKLFNPSSDLSTDQRVVQYAPHFRLSFSLLNEDISTSMQSGWAVEPNLDAMIKPTLNMLAPLYNFTVESQVQYYAPLAFDPPRHLSVMGPYYGLGEDELKIFVNSAEWTLSSKITNDPVLHFILFAPAAKHRPLLIYDEIKETFKKTPAFIIPQWGGVVLFNPTTEHSPKSGAEIFALFRTQLLTLLGVPQLPANVKIRRDGFGEQQPLSLWQVDALLRKRARENMKGSVQALASITALVEKLDNMPVGMDVRGEVLSALEELEKTQNPLDTSYSLAQLFTHSQRSQAYSSNAFFNPGMVGQLYFPAEHKYAIYMLFAPASMPLIVTLIKEIRNWRSVRRKRMKVE